MSKSNSSSQAFETRCVHAGVSPEPITGAVMTPIFQTSTYAQEAPGHPKVHDYSRAGNPTRDALETSLAALEGARHALSYSSGLAATQAIAQLLEPGDHVLVSEDVYGGTGRLFRRFYAKYGITFDFVDLRDTVALAGLIQPKTKLIWAESPTNPLLRLLDIEATAKLTKKHNIIFVLDNTFASPALQNPLVLGADIVLHSTTKYIGGHSDLVGGAIMVNDDELFEKLKFTQFAIGAVNSPFESFLLLRSIKTLALRMERHNENGLALAEALKRHKDFVEVVYPGLPDHPQHELAKRQQRGFGGIISARLAGGPERVTKFVQALEIFTLAESLGGVESLVNHPETMTHASVPPELRKKLGITSDLLRFSVGIEKHTDLVADIEQAIQKTK